MIEIMFIKGCASVDTVYKKGGIYSLPDFQANGFINGGLAEKVGDNSKTPVKATAKSAENRTEQTAANKGTGKPVKRRTRTKK